MFARLLFESFRRQRRRKAFALLAIALGMSISTAMIAVATDVGDKMNYELLGNAMPHLHWHLVPRYVTDPMWGRPIWPGSKRRKRLNREGYDSLKALVEKYLDQKSKSSRETH